MDKYVKQTIKKRDQTEKGPKAPKYTRGLLKLYSQHAVSPMKGAYME